jgi:hypothetical protein
MRASDRFIDLLLVVAGFAAALVVYNSVFEGA